MRIKIFLGVNSEEERQVKGAHVTFDIADVRKPLFGSCSVKHAVLEDVGGTTVRLMADSFSIVA